MKKFIAFLLAFTMLFSIAVPAFAGGDEIAVPSIDFGIFETIINGISGFFNDIIDFFKNLINPPDPLAYYTISYVDTNGDLIYKKSYAVGSSIPAPEIPVKDGYVFMSWYPALPDTMPERDLVVTAQWAEIN